MNSVESRRFASRTFICIFAGLASLVFAGEFLASLHWWVAVSICATLGIIIAVILAIFSTDLRTVMAGVTALSFCLSIWVTHWPMNMAFAISKPQLENFAERIENGEQVSTPCFVGVFRVRRIEQKPDGAICFWTSLRPSGLTGIIKCPREELRFNVWSHHEFEDSWHLISED